MILTLIDGVDVDECVRRSIIGSERQWRGNLVTRNCRRGKYALYNCKAAKSILV